MSKESKNNPLSAFDTVAACDQGAEMELLKPVDRSPSGIFITVKGKDSTVYKDFMRQSINDRLRREQMAKKRGRDTDVPTFEKNEDENIDLLTVCTVGWRNMPNPDGSKEPFPFNVKNAREIYTRYPNVRQQVDEFIAELSNFIKG